VLLYLLLLIFFSKKKSFFPSITYQPQFLSHFRVFTVIQSRDPIHG
jgi:hypothetical protein